MILKTYLEGTRIIDGVPIAFNINRLLFKNWKELNFSVYNPNLFNNNLTKANNY